MAVKLLTISAGNSVSDAAAGAGAGADGAGGAAAGASAGVSAAAGAGAGALAASDEAAAAGAGAAAAFFALVTMTTKKSFCLMNNFLLMFIHGLILHKEKMPKSHL